MTIRALTMGVAALTLAGIGGATAQSVYVEQFTPGQVYITPSSIDGYVIEQRLVPAAPAATYEQQTVTPRITPQQRIVTERRVIKETPRGARTQRIITETKSVVTEPRIVTTAQPAIVAPSIVTQPTIVTQTQPHIVAPADDTTYLNSTETGTTGM